MTAHSGFPFLTSLMVLPVAAILVLLILRRDSAVRSVTLAVGVLEVLLSIPLYSFAPSLPGFQFVELKPWVPQWGMNYYLGLDGLSLFMVLLSTLLLPLCVLCSWTYIKARVKEFHICLLVMTAACVGVFSALDLVLFYVFWEAMLVPMFLLIAVWGGPERRYASLKFFLYTLAGSTLLLVAIIAFRAMGGSFAIPELLGRDFPVAFQRWTFLAMALAFAIKVPMFPFHTWLPAAHVQAPSAGSVILAAVLLKMGTYGFMRFCLGLTPEASHFFAPLMIALSVASILYGGLTALGQTDLKRMVAYSSVGHMGFVTLGIFMFNMQGLSGALLQMLNHGITTGALFMMLGAAYERSHSREMADHLGMGKYLPAFMGMWGLFALSSLAFPGTNSFVGELLVLTGAFSANLWAAFLSVPGAMLAAAYMLRATRSMAWGSPTTAKGWADLNVREWTALTPLAVLVLYIGFAPGLALKAVEPSLERLLVGVNKHAGTATLTTGPVAVSSSATLSGKPGTVTAKTGSQVNETPTTRLAEVAR
ncbi:MAG: NADH-quinone oxidoreductase subunit M [Desulfovibrio sp.]|nr:NADH-quinone oxidoreductase subunit M [Desulfovibrio sp.]MBI4960929.1 NADH-quinone oxidoreductase subunit M [Desulfovibrio sp.]